MITLLTSAKLLKGYKVSGKWYIKTHRGEELGPVNYADLLDMLSSPPYSENATLIRPEWRDTWKPALIEIPSLMDSQEEEAIDTPVPAIPAANESVAPASLYLHIRRSRLALLPLAIVSLIGMTALLLKLLEVPGGYNVTDPLVNSNRAMFCTILFIFPLGALWKMAYASFQIQLAEERYIQLFVVHMERFWFTLLFAILATLGAYLITSISQN